MVYLCCCVVLLQSAILSKNINVMEESKMFKMGIIFALFFIEVLSPTLLHPPEPVEMGKQA